MAKKWWRITNRGSRTAEVLIYGDIVDEKWAEEDVTPTEFKRELEGLGRLTQLDVHINSAGGSVFAGFTIYNILKRHTANVTTYVDGMAASIASVILQAGDRRIMATNGMLMIHNPLAIAAGNAEDFRELADNLDKVKEPIVRSYSNRATITEDEIKALMDAETWMTADEAVEMGFADSVDSSKFASATAKGKSVVVNGLTFDVARFKSFDAGKFVTRPAARKPAPAKPKAKRLSLGGSVAEQLLAAEQEVMANEEFLHRHRHSQ